MNDYKGDKRKTKTSNYPLFHHTIHILLLIRVDNVA